MTKYLTLQSNFFIVITLISLFFSLLAPGVINVFNILSLVLVIAIFGLPHGALDTLFAKKAFLLSTKSSWLIFISAYLLLSALVLAFWLLLPSFFFILFLGFSAAHFSDDLGENQPALRLALYGINIITLPSILYSYDLTVLYGYFIGNTYNVNIVNVMKPLAIISGLLTIWITFIYFSKNKDNNDERSILELIVVSALMLLVKPLLAFTIYFCLMHSARHIIRAKFYFNEYSNTTMQFTLVIPTLSVLVFCLLIFQLLPIGKVDENLIKVTFAVLAALTFPHAFLLGKVGFIKWIRSYSAKHVL